VTAFLHSVTIRRVRPVIARGFPALFDTHASRPSYGSESSIRPSTRRSIKLAGKRAFGPLTQEMRMKSTPLIVALIAAAGFAGSALAQTDAAPGSNPPAATPSPNAQKGPLKQDQKAVRTDRRKLREDNKDLRSDRAKLKADEAAKADKSAIEADKQKLSADRAKRKEDRKQLHTDREKRRDDRGASKAK